MIIQEDGKSCFTFLSKLLLNVICTYRIRFPTAVVRSGRTHLVVYVNDGDAWSERNRDDGVYKRISEFEKSSWN